MKTFVKVFPDFINDKLYLKRKFTDEEQLIIENIFNEILKRNVDIHDVGNSALYLLSELANGVTGEIHYVDAGYNKVGMPDPKNIT